MKKGVITGLGIAGVGAIVLLATSFFTVSEVQQALVVEFGKPRKTISEPGLKMKIPFIQDVVYMDKRLIDFNAPPKEIITADKKWVIVDAFVRYRITDPLKFYQSVHNERGMSQRLDSILEASLKQVVGRENFKSLLSPERARLMYEIRDEVNAKTKGIKPASEAETEEANRGPEEAAAEGAEAPAEPELTKETEAEDPSMKFETAMPRQEQAGDQSYTGFGIDVVDVRIMRVELPSDNTAAIYRRMETERQREAKEIRAEGEEQAQRIRARADKTRTILLANAKKQSEIIRGEGDARAVKIFADAFNRDKEFFDFYRSMQAYRKAINKDDTTLILSPNSEFMRYFRETNRPR